MVIGIISTHMQACSDQKICGYLLENYVTHYSKFPSEMWAEICEQGAPLGYIICVYITMANGRSHL